MSIIFRFFVVMFILACLLFIAMAMFGDNIKVDRVFDLKKKSHEPGHRWFYN